MAARKGKMIKKMTQSAFHQPLNSLSRNRSAMIWNSTIKYITKKKVQTRSQKKSQKLSITPTFRLSRKEAGGRQTRLTLGHVPCFISEFNGSPHDGSLPSRDVIDHPWRVIPRVAG